ncbi:hypothetical protein THAOC_09604 [Thalassiosira oceanica]|uniref:Uncharacterized protein n=1 Tax=Thalassiosira oceanica TaxID=159749 RepID=K0SW47_THAOC|nr:hypothetical protein THAOC_09604 [Thalassiosira oceanica]|eukprot:EJK69169.1 hypothetical protein THAOC_09604 [Thalassiosira oceanica]
MASPGGPMMAPMAPIHPQYIPYEVPRPHGYSNGSTAVVIYQTSQCNGKFAHHQTSPAYRGPGAVDNGISIEAVYLIPGYARWWQNFIPEGYGLPASGVWGDDGVYRTPARPSALYTPTGPLGRSVASVDLKQPIDASSAVDLSAPICSRPSHEWFFLSHVSLLQAADVAGNRLSLNRADEDWRKILSSAFIRLIWRYVL